MTDDPARAFLDDVLPTDDEWLGREPAAGPARPRHVQYPVEPQPPVDPRVWRRQAIRNAAWTFGPTLGWLAAGYLLSGDGTN